MPVAVGVAVLVLVVAFALGLLASAICALARKAPAPRPKAPPLAKSLPPSTKSWATSKPAPRASRSISFQDDDPAPKIRASRSVSFQDDDPLDGSTKTARPGPLRDGTTTELPGLLAGQSVRTTRSSLIRFSDLGVARRAARTPPRRASRDGPR